MTINKRPHILLTRPKHQAQALMSALQALPAHVELFPTLEIVPVNVEASQYRNSLEQADKVIFTSANAVEHGLELLPEEHVKLKQLFAIGTGTEAALANNNINNVIKPSSDFSSEGLLALPELQDVAQQDITIIKGEGGRELLQTELTQRQANVSIINVYKRVMPDIDVTSYFEEWNNQPIDLIISTSSESLDNLWQMFGSDSHAWLSKTAVLVLSENMQQTAQQLGFTNIICAEQSSDSAVVQTVQQYLSNI